MQGSGNVAEEAGRAQQSEEGEVCCKMLSSAHGLADEFMDLQLLWSPVQDKASQIPSTEGIDGL